MCGYFDEMMLDAGEKCGSLLKAETRDSLKEKPILDPRSWILVKGERNGIWGTADFAFYCHCYYLKPETREKPGTGHRWGLPVPEGRGLSAGKKWTNLFFLDIWKKYCIILVIGR